MFCLTIGDPLPFIPVPGVADILDEGPVSIVIPDIPFQVIAKLTTQDIAVLVESSFDV